MNGVEPTTVGEMELFKVLQRANLLIYYDVFISHGGDDVQQLCEAGEEEFLEIMALVGMASKPLHVRRLQKTLQEWVTAPYLFQSYDTPMSGSGTLKSQDILQKLHKNIPRPNDRHINFPDKRITDYSTRLSYRSSSHHTPVFQKQSHHVHDSRPYTDATFQLKSRGSTNKTVRTPPKIFTGSEDAATVEETTGCNLDESTLALIAKFTRVELERRYPTRLSFEKSVEYIKTSKKHLHLIRVLEMEDIFSRDRELRRQSALFPIGLPERFSTAPVNLYETMCNEASAHLCQLHPMLLVAERQERLEAAQAVVKKVEKHIEQSQREPLDLAMAATPPAKVADVKAKLEEVRVQRHAFKRKILEAKEAKNFINVLEYQTEVSRLNEEEQSLRRRRDELLTQHGLRTAVFNNNSHKETIENVETNGPKNAGKNSLDELHLQSSTLADLARAHNVLASNEYEDRLTDLNNGETTDLGVKKEMLDESVSGNTGLDFSTSKMNVALKRQHNRSPDDVSSAMKRPRSIE